MNSIEQPAFKRVFESTALNDGLYFFLQLVHRRYPEDAFHYTIALAIKEKKTDEEIYKEAQRNLAEIKPFLQWLNYTLPGLRKLRKELRLQVAQVTGDRHIINGYLEIGTKGRFAGIFNKNIKVKGPVYVMDEAQPPGSIKGMLERGRFGSAGHFIPLDYEVTNMANIPAESLDMVTCYNGLHFCPDERLGDFITKMHRVLRKGGLFIIREYDVTTQPMQLFASIVHTVTNLGANVPWAKEVKEYRSFRSAEEWSNIICSYSFEDKGYRLRQDKDPTLNTLMAFEKL